MHPHRPLGTLLHVLKPLRKHPSNALARRLPHFLHVKQQILEPRMQRRKGLLLPLGIPSVPHIQERLVRLHIQRELDPDLRRLVPLRDPPPYQIRTVLLVVSPKRRVLVPTLTPHPMVRILDQDHGHELLLIDAFPPRLGHVLQPMRRGGIVLPPGNLPSHPVLAGFAVHGAGFFDVAVGFHEFEEEVGPGVEEAGRADHAMGSGDGVSVGLAGFEAADDGFVAVLGGDVSPGGELGGEFLVDFDVGGAEDFDYVGIDSVAVAIAAIVAIVVVSVVVVAAVVTFVVTNEISIEIVA
mmetsp:Transcript_27147/g.56022  ORF Transcript_27147/g.56022 Transcript_27147/m.56022 type:complete len:296 (+) Transcript_27147:329-1216(+)